MSIPSGRSSAGASLAERNHIMLRLQHAPIGGDAGDGVTVGT